MFTSKKEVLRKIHGISWQKAEAQPLQKGEDDPRSVMIPRSSYRLGTFLIKQKRVVGVDQRVGMLKDFHSAITV